MLNMCGKVGFCCVLLALVLMGEVHPTPTVWEILFYHFIPYIYELCVLNTPISMRVFDNFL